MSTKNQLLTFGLMFLVVSIVLKQLDATEYPTPPPVPAKFESPQDVQRYLNQLHNYYMVVGRPRFGKRTPLGTLLTDTLPYLKQQQQQSNSQFNDYDLTLKPNNNINNDYLSTEQLFKILDLNGIFCLNL